MILHLAPGSCHQNRTVCGCPRCPTRIRHRNDRFHITRCRQIRDIGTGLLVGRVRLPVYRQLYGRIHCPTDIPSLDLPYPSIWLGDNDQYDIRRTDGMI